MKELLKELIQSAPLVIRDWRINIWKKKYEIYIKKCKKLLMDI